MALNRLRRTNYILWQLLFGVIFALGVFLTFAIFGIFGYMAYKFGLLFAFALLEMYLTARRLHDCNISGWFSLLLLSQVLILPAVIFLCIVPGTNGPNKFGEDPRLKSNKSKE